MLLAINFHYVRRAFDDPFPGVHGVTPEQFAAQLQLLGNEASYVSAADVPSILEERRVDEPPNVLVTFDDGLREQFEVALPILEDLGIPALFFVNTGPIVDRSVSLVHKVHLMRARTAPAELMDRLARTSARLGIDLVDVDPGAAREQYPYDAPEHAELKYRLGFGIPQRKREQLIEELFEERFPGREAEMADELYMEAQHLRALAQRDALGTHGHEHVALGTVPSEQAEKLLRLSVETIETITGIRPTFLSYPYGGAGSTSPAVAEHARRLGIRFAFTMERVVNVGPLDPLHLGRFDCNDLPGGKSPICAVSDLHRLPVGSDRRGTP